MKQARIAIFATGRGTNAQKVIEHFKRHSNIRVNLILSNNVHAGVLEIAHHFQIPAVTFNKHDFYETNMVTQALQEAGITHIVLAGFLWLIPSALIQQFSNRMVNIHPALLPKFGGKGMFGMHVHKAVKQSGETTTGITIHLVNENYDEGSILHQQTIQLTGDESPEDIALKVQSIEHQYYPIIIENWIKDTYFGMVE